MCSCSDNLATYKNLMLKSGFLQVTKVEDIQLCDVFLHLLILLRAISEDFDGDLYRDPLRVWKKTRLRVGSNGDKIQSST